MQKSALNTLKQSQNISNMEAFLDHMAFVCLAGAVIGLILIIPIFIMEKLDEYYDGKISAAICRFLGADLDEDSEDDFDEE